VRATSLLAESVTEYLQRFTNLVWSQLSLNTNNVSTLGKSELVTSGTAAVKEEDVHRGQSQLKVCK
jgi:hypothetical protein